jgi:1-deoxy-D-xylulose-5-phosphate reductoisomerase
MDWTAAHRWDFAPPDWDKFPLLRLAYQAMEAGGSATCTLNAADEIAVEAFLAGRIRFTEIAAVVEETLARTPSRRAGSAAELLAIDEESRAGARQALAARSRQTANALAC